MNTSGELTIESIKWSDTLFRLIDAGFLTVAESGLEKLTLKAVADRAKLSKGALLYHFPSKADLVQKMLEVAVDIFNHRVDEVRGEDRTPGSYTRAYVQVTFGVGGDSDEFYFFALAALGRESALRQNFAKAVEQWSGRIEDDGLDPVTAQAVRLAADGLWWSEAANARPLDPKLRDKVRQYLLQMLVSAGASRQPGVAE